MMTIATIPMIIPMKGYVITLTVRGITAVTMPGIGWLNLRQLYTPDPAETANRSMESPPQIEIQLPSPGAHSSINPAQPNCVSIFLVKAFMKKMSIVGGRLHILL